MGKGAGYEDDKKIEKDNDSSLLARGCSYLAFFRRGLIHITWPDWQQHVGKTVRRYRASLYFVTTYYIINAQMFLCCTVNADVKEINMRCAGGDVILTCTEFDDKNSCRKSRVLFITSDKKQVNIDDRSTLYPDVEERVRALELDGFMADSVFCKESPKHNSYFILRYSNGKDCRECVFFDMFDEFGRRETLQGENYKGDRKVLSGPIDGFNGSPFQMLTLRR
jgi:hypothetical protein